MKKAEKLLEMLSVSEATNVKKLLAMETKLETSFEKFASAITDFVDTDEGEKVFSDVKKFIKSLEGIRSNLDLIRTPLRKA